LRKINLFWRLNEQIRAPEVRVIGENGKQLGIMKIEEAVKLARERELTLVEIAPTAKPPVTKIVEFGKFRYQEEKKAKSQLKKSKGGELKEIRFSPFIAENDYLVRFTKVKEFLGKKDKVRLVVVFRGPQMRSKQFGYNLLAKIVSELGDTISIDMKPKFLGKHLMMVISPTNKSKSLKELESRINK
jgi:translation initiation factor IF-3